MSTLRNRGRLARMFLVLLVSVLGFGAATLTVPATPAHAAPGFKLCVPIFDEGGTKIIGWDCRWFDLPVEVPCPPCPDWGLTLEHLVNPPDRWYVEDLLDGLELLGQAAANPREADQLRAAAQREFTVAARRAGGAEIRLGEVGVVDWERNAIDANPVAWLVAAGTDLADGLGLMQRGLVAAAMTQFGEAYEEIAQQRPIGS